MHEPPAAAADMAVLPDVLGSRTLRRTKQYASGPVPRCRGMVARWHDHLRLPPGSPGARVVCDAKRMRSLYLPSLTERPPERSTSFPPTGRASPYTIDAATTPWRGFAEQTPLSRSRDGVSCIMRASE